MLFVKSIVHICFRYVAVWQPQLYEQWNNQCTGIATLNTVLLEYTFKP